jgi:predicted AlkP superfamily phosphohydrolase/phosphomutase/tetratricopeptide (TPR) repeat protein
VTKPADKQRRRVLLVGWDAADCQMINPLVERGLMPTTAKFVAEGAHGNLATTRPILSPILWNSIATGKRAAEHGVLGFTEPDPDGHGVRTTSSTSRRCKALWNILTQSGLRSNVVGWYASHPAEPILGAMVSNQFERYTIDENGASPVATGAVHPASMKDTLAELRVLPSEIDATAILPFVPDAAKIVDDPKSRLGMLQHLLAQTATVHAVATHLIATTDWDFTAVYYEGIDRFGHEFMEFHPPKMEQVSQEDFDAYKLCMEGAYRFHDMLLDTLLQLVGDDTMVVLMSDHGYFNDHLRPDPRVGHAGPVDWHRPFGVFACRGPGVSRGERLYGASILDVTPTVLHLMGLPAAHDMPGRVLVEALEDREPLPRIESWEDVPGEAGMLPSDLRIDPAESRAALEQLVALGYVEAPSEDETTAAHDTQQQNLLSLAQSLHDARRMREALDAINKLDESLRGGPGVKLFAASCHLALDEREAARALLEPLTDTDESPPQRELMLAALDVADRKLFEAGERLERLRDRAPRSAGLHVKLGELYLDMSRYADAVKAFDTALAIDGDSAMALAGVARARLELGDHQGALDQALLAAELVHHFPRVHLTIGRALAAMGDDTGAVEALELCVKQAPRMRAAHHALSESYRRLGDEGRARDAELRARGVLT